LLGLRADMDMMTPALAENPALAIYYNNNNVAD
jgi:hypothetical protein